MGLAELPIDKKCMVKTNKKKNQDFKKGNKKGEIGKEQWKEAQNNHFLFKERWEGFFGEITSSMFAVQASGACGLARSFK